MHLWPATFIDIYPDQIDTWQLFPDGLRRTSTEARVYHSGLRTRSATGWCAAINWRVNTKVMDEDVELCDMVQLGLESRTYERGVLNRNENGVLAFHDLLRRGRAGHRRAVRIIRGDDRWLFLTPEIEREVPSLLDALGAGDADARGGAGSSG